MLGSGDEPDPLVIKKVERRDKILYYKSTTNHKKEKSLRTTTIIPQSFSIWKMQLSQMSKIFLTSSTFTWSYPGQNTVVPPVVRSRTVYMTIGCKAPPLARNTFLRLRKRRYSCECGKRFFGKNTFLPRYYRATSRMVEGCNNKTKALKRACFGMRNFRNRILFRNT